MLRAAGLEPGVGREGFGALLPSQIRYLQAYRGAEKDSTKLFHVYKMCPWRVIDKRINKGMLSEGIAERKIPHTENPPEAWP